jgi:hypothetical protein
MAFDPEEEDGASAASSWPAALPPGFDGLQCITSYGDLIPMLGADAATGRRHHAEFGRGEGRAKDTFDEAQYPTNYPDLLVGPVDLLGGGDGAPEEPLGRERGPAPGDGGALADLGRWRHGADQGRRGRDRGHGRGEERRDGDSEAGGHTLARTVRHPGPPPPRLPREAAGTG